MDGENLDFIGLSHLLDEHLNQIVGGEQNRIQYIPYNQLNGIQDVILAYDDVIPIGCASFRYYSDKVAEVKRVFVKDAYRGRGISKKIMNLLEQRAKDKGFNKFILESGYPLIVAMHLYRSLGFKVMPNYGVYKDMVDSICMEKIIR